MSLSWFRNDSNTYYPITYITKNKLPLYTDTLYTGDTPKLNGTEVDSYPSVQRGIHTQGLLVRSNQKVYLQLPDETYIEIGKTDSIIDLTFGDGILNINDSKRLVEWHDFKRLHLYVKTVPNFTGWSLENPSPSRIKWSKDNRIPLPEIDPVDTTAELVAPVVAPVAPVVAQAEIVASGDNIEELPEASMVEGGKRKSRRNRKSKKSRKGKSRKGKSRKNHIKSNRRRR
jgi:hypothetical protein